MNIEVIKEQVHCFSLKLSLYNSRILYESFCLIIKKENVSPLYITEKEWNRIKLLKNKMEDITFQKLVSYHFNIEQADITLFKYVLLFNYIKLEQSLSMISSKNVIFDEMCKAKKLIIVDLLKLLET